MKSLFIGLFIALTFPRLWAQQEVEVLEPMVISATRISQPYSEIGKTFSMIQSSQIQDEKSHFLVNSMKQLPGVRIDSKRYLGGLSTVRIRGASSYDTQLLMNGIALRDPSDPQGSANPFWTYLNTSFINDVELMRGSNGVLYGSDNAGGSVNINTAKGQVGDPHLKIKSEVGSLDTFIESVSLFGGIDSVQYYGSFERTDTDGMDDNDDFFQNQGYLRFDVQPNSSIQTNFWILSNTAEVDIDQAPFFSDPMIVTNLDDPNDTREDSWVHYGMQIQHQMSDQWDQSLRLGQVFSDREFLFLLNPDGTGFDANSQYKGISLNVDWQINYSMNDMNAINFGYEYEWEKMNQNTKDFETRVKEQFDQDRHSLWLQYQLIDWHQFSLLPSIRYSSHQTVDDSINGQIQGVYDWQDYEAKIHSHWATGYRAPSLFELFGASTFYGVRTVFGNTELENEESYSYDVGISKKFWNQKIDCDITFFRNDFNQRIVFQDGIYQNQDGGYSQGVELTTQIIWCQQLSSYFNYTLTEGEDNKGFDLVGIPQNAFSIGMKASFGECLNIYVTGQYRGNEDYLLFSYTDFQEVRLEDEAYFKLNLNIEYTWNDHIKTYLKFDNVMDDDYQEAAYVAPGFLVFAGTEIQI